MQYVLVDDVNAHHDRAKAAGATIIEELIDMPVRRSPLWLPRHTGSRVDLRDATRRSAVSPPGFEPGTKGLKVPCSSVELRARKFHSRRSC